MGKDVGKPGIKDKRLLNAIRAWEELRHSPELIFAFESYVKQVIDEEARIDFAKHRGKEEVNREVILAGAKRGLDIATLAKITGYSEERVEEIQKEES